MGVLVFFACVGAITTIFLVGLGGLFLWLWWAEKIINQPNKPNKKHLKELKKEWQLSAVEDR